MTHIARRYYKSKYKYVQNLKANGEDYWTHSLPNVTRVKYATEREAALAVDKYLISKGRMPVNILVAK